MGRSIPADAAANMALSWFNFLVSENKMSPEVDMHAIKGFMDVLTNWLAQIGELEERDEYEFDFAKDVDEAALAEFTAALVQGTQWREDTWEYQRKFLALGMINLLEQNADFRVRNHELLVELNQAANSEQSILNKRFPVVDGGKE